MNAVSERLIAFYVAVTTARDERGQTAVEYALILGLVSIVLALAIAAGMTGALDTTITKIKNALT